MATSWPRSATFRPSPLTETHPPRYPRPRHTRPSYSRSSLVADWEHRPGDGAAHSHPRRRR